MKNRVLIVEPCHPVLNEELNKAGYDCEINTEISYNQLCEMGTDLYGLIVRSKFKVDKNLLDKAVNLKFVGRVGSGMELIDQKYAAEKGVLCFNSPEGNKDSVAEHAIAQMISLLKNIGKSGWEMRNGTWLRQDNKGRELGSQIVGIIGFGNTGSSLAKKLSGFNCEILAHDKYKNNFGTPLVKEVELEEIFEKADVLSLHLPLNEETKWYANANFFSKFKKEIFLINTSRGEIVSTSNLIEAVKSGKIKAAALDVFEEEPLGVSTDMSRANLDFLRSDLRILLSPHTAGLTVDSYYKLGYILSQKITKSSYLSAESHN